MGLFSLALVLQVLRDISSGWPKRMPSSRSYDVKLISSVAATRVKYDFAKGSEKEFRNKTGIYLWIFA